MTRVVFLVLDGLPSRHVTPEVSPNLCALAGEAGHGPGVATGVMPAATYPNHATFVTGRRPVDHGIVANWFFVDGKPVPAESVGPAGSTLFDACREAGRASAFVAGDQHLVKVMAGDRADTHWPPDGAVPEGAAIDAMGYLDDAETVPHLAAALDNGHDLVVAQINGPDTAGHRYGPDADEALDAYRVTDGLIPALREALAPAWNETVVIAVSDHTMEPLTHPEPIDAWRLAEEQGMHGLPEGGAALFEGNDEPSWLRHVEGCAGYEPIAAGRWLAWTDPGYWFAVDGLDAEYRGMHGNPTTLEQVAVVTGGHPLARVLAERVSPGDVTALDWGPTIAGLLGLALPGAAGRDLLSSHV